MIDYLALKNGHVFLGKLLLKVRMEFVKRFFFSGHNGRFPLSKPRIQPILNIFQANRLNQHFRNILVSLAGNAPGTLKKRFGDFYGHTRIHDAESIA